MTDEELHRVARETAATLIDPDKKQLRFNDIVECAKMFYPNCPATGVRELIEACDRSGAESYVKGSPMHESLSQNYSWMVAQ